MRQKKVVAKERYLKLLKVVSDFNRAHGWDPLPSDIAKSVVIEAAELLEKYQWDETDRERHGLPNPKNKEELGEEVADVFWYLVTLCAKEDIDLLHVLKDKLRKNELKYPTKKFKGKHNQEFYIAQKRKYRENRKKK